MALALLALALSVGLCGAQPFPHYLQCDPRWGNDTMGIVGNGERNTICREGCAMTSVSMALAGLGVRIDGHLVTPKSFNRWLIANEGYLCLANDCNNLKLDALEKLTTVMTLIGEAEKPPIDVLQSRLKNERQIVVAHVRHNSHFVLLTGSVAGRRAFTVLDPYYNTSVYDFANVSDTIRYTINPYPLYRQCDKRWGHDVMEGTSTICAVGCLMASTSSALSGVGIAWRNLSLAPGWTNHFLRTHSGYDSHSDMLESVIPTINPKRVSWPPDGMHRSNDIPFGTITRYINQATPRIVIANVKRGEHFVLVVGYRGDNDTLVVNDSGFDRNTYSYKTDVVGWRLFDMR